jgi:hypothetical protein
MCDQRERLLSYVYDEGDARERAEVQEHLDQCPDCRAEVAGLRSVRSDLLAWEVPAHEPVWRPFVAAPPVPWWRQVPAWAMAAAAGVMLLLGATGGVVAHSLMPDRMIAQRGSDATLPTTPAGVTMEDLKAAEERVLARLQQQVGEVDQRVQRVSNRSGSVPAIELDHNALYQEVLQLRSRDAAQLKIIGQMQEDLAQLKKSSNFAHANLEARLGNLTSYVVNSGSGK